MTDRPGRPVLALRALGLGDALTGVPALRALRRAVRPRPVILAAPAVLGSWLTDLNVVDGFVDTTGLADPPPGRQLGAHDAVDLHGNGPASRDLLAAGHPHRLLGFALPGGTGVPWRVDEHEVDRWCRLVRAWGAVGCRDDLRLRVPAVPPARTAQGAVVVHPGAASGSRRWPVERWAAVIRALSRDGTSVLLSGGPSERDLCQQLAAAADLPASASTAGQLGLPALAGLIQSARLVLCGDTGVAHLATALGTPSVVLFGPVSPATWGPAIDPDLHTVLWHGDGSGDPHGDSVDPSLLRITVEQVTASARAALDRSSGGDRVLVARAVPGDSPA
ncbi:MAG: glycosyltransferase family 9 protein [Actinomycetales bacterium]